MPYERVAPGVTVDSGDDSGWFGSIFPWDYDSDVRVSWFAANSVRSGESESFDSDAKDRVLAAIRETPGIYVSAVAEDTSLHRSTVRYHVRKLAEDGAIRTTKDQGKRRVYPTGVDGDDRPDILSDEAPAQVAVTVARFEPVSVSRIATEIERAPSTVSYHLDRLTDANVVRQSRDGNRKLISVHPEVRDTVVAMTKTTFSARAGTP